MALIHAASLSPSKAELIAAWLPTQPWASGGSEGAEVELVAAFRFDDPYGEVGVETHLARWGGRLVQVPLTYRGSALVGAEHGLVGTMEHTVLGTRWVYDGTHDPVALALLATTTLTGVGQAAQLADIDGRTITAPPSALVRGGGWTGGRVAVDGFGEPTHDGGWTVVRSDRLELRLARTPSAARDAGDAEGHRLTGTWAGQDEPALLAVVRSLP